MQVAAQYLEVALTHLTRDVLKQLGEQGYDAYAQLLRQPQVILFARPAPGAVPHEHAGANGQRVEAGAAQGSAASSSTLLRAMADDEP